MRLRDAALLFAALMVSMWAVPAATGGRALAAGQAQAQPSAKRVAPPDVPPVQLRKVRIEAVHWGRARGFNQNGGYIAAIDPASGQELWTLKVYDVHYDPKMEEDVQDVFIRKMTRMSPSRLLIVDEKGRRYRVDVKRRAVTPRPTPWLRPRHPSRADAA
jgi:hypothetical protein